MEMTMKAGFVSDIHGDSERLERAIDVLHRGEEVNRIFCLGDIVGPAGDVEGCIDLLRNKLHYEIETVFGNHDMQVRWDAPQNALGREPGGGYEVEVRENLSEDAKEYISRLPEKMETGMSRMRLLMAHAYALSPDRNYCGYPANNYVRKSDWTKYGKPLASNQILCMGHTHQRGFLNLHKFKGLNGYMFNPGSLGQNGDCGLLKITGKTVSAEFFRV